MATKTERFQLPHLTPDESGFPDRDFCRLRARDGWGKLEGSQQGTVSPGTGEHGLVAWGDHSWDHWRCRGFSWTYCPQTPQACITKSDH